MERVLNDETPELRPILERAKAEWDDQRVELERLRRELEDAKNELDATRAIQIGLYQEAIELEGALKEQSE